jgi:hypothetical protein
MSCYLDDIVFDVLFIISFINAIVVILINLKYKLTKLFYYELHFFEIIFIILIRISSKHLFFIFIFWI